MTQRSVVFLYLLLASPPAPPVAQQPYDVLITGGSVLNGEGASPCGADVGLRRAHRDHRRSPDRGGDAPD